MMRPQTLKRTSSRTAGTGKLQNSRNLDAISSPILGAVGNPSCPPGVSQRRLTVVLEELHVALMFFGFSASGKRAQVAAFAGPGICLLRVKPILARLEFTDHIFLLGKYRFA